MAAPLTTSSSPILDLAMPAPFAIEALLLDRLPVGHGDQKLVTSLVSSDSSRDRTRRLNDFFLRAEPSDAVEVLKAAAKLALRHEQHGVRFLFGFLEVRPPGVEVLRRLQTLSSMERVALRLVANTWTEPQEAPDVSPVFPILEVLEEGTRIGALDLGIETLPRRTQAVGSLFSHLRSWMDERVDQLEQGHRIKDDAINFITQLSLLEITLLEKRVSRLAGEIDPYDAMAMARLLPVVSRYDQEIEHMKEVVGRLTTYEPFFDRRMTVEHTVTAKEMSKLERALSADPLGRPLGRLLGGMRAHPLLDREFGYLVAVVSQMAELRTEVLPRSPRLDLLSIMALVVEGTDAERTLRVAMEQRAADALWPRLQNWGAVRTAPKLLQIQIRRDRLDEFLGPDGTPCLSSAPPDRERPPLGIKDLVRLQMDNDSFILGILDNPRATVMPGVVTLIAEQTRSLRVLDKVISGHALHTGINKDVPRVLLANPSRMPMNRIRRFVHVRFVAKTDLERMARPRSGTRPEVQKEIETYLRTLKH